MLGRIRESSTSGETTHITEVIDVNLAVTFLDWASFFDAP